MKKSELFEQYQEIIASGDEVDCIILYIHMPTGEQEVIVNPNVEEKIAYINRTYNDDLVHNNCEQIYIEDVIFTVDHESAMDFGSALDAMKAGAKVKLPSWGGYWYWDAEKETVMMHTKEGVELDIRQTDRVAYTLENLLSDEWIIADEENCPQLGGEATFSFGDAIKYLKRGFKVARKGWNGKDQYLTYIDPYANEQFTLVEENPLGTFYPYIAIKTNYNAIVPWFASQTDTLANDWVFVDEE